MGQLYVEPQNANSQPLSWLRLSVHWVIGTLDNIEWRNSTPKEKNSLAEQFAFSLKSQFKLACKRANSHAIPYPKMCIIQSGHILHTNKKFPHSSLPRLVGLLGQYSTTNASSLGEGNDYLVVSRGNTPGISFNPKKMCWKPDK